MDYSQLSDFEINRRVAIATGHKKFNSLGWQGLQEDGCNAVIVRGPMKIGGFDPCNNPADAWPIIVKNLLTMKPVVYQGTVNWIVSRDIHAHHDTNPLRAAMIVFLMLQTETGVEG